MNAVSIIIPFLLGTMVTPSLASQENDAFWKRTQTMLAGEPMESKVEDLKEPLPYAKYKVTLRSLNGVRFTTLLALPIQAEAPAKPWPVIITTPGYGGTQQGVMLSECQRGYAILQVFPRGQGESTEQWKLNGDKLTSHLEKPEGHYYQGAYADVMRAIDFAVSRADLDHDRIALVGTSQGGGISLAVAALDSRVKAVVAHVPFLCNFRLAAAIPSRIKAQLDQANRNDEPALRTLDYFDPFLLAPQLRVPVLMSAGGKDEVCPSPTIKSVYERLPGTKKELKLYPDLIHSSCVDFYNYTWIWLDENFRDAKGPR
jgi:cephalosporin-C deacetylase